MFNIRPFANIVGTYEDGLTPASVQPDGQIPNRASAGWFANFGAYGYHQWRKSQLALAYNGRARHYTRSRNQDGVDHTLALSYVNQPTARMQFSLVQVAGTYSRSVGLPGVSLTGGQAFGFTPNLSSTVPNVQTVPQGDIFDTRTDYLSSSGGLRYNTTARLSFGAQATGFAVRRRATALAGLVGAGANGDVRYALSRRQSVGLGYSYATWSYNRSFGDANIHSTYLFYNRQLSRRWMGGGALGTFRLEALGLTRVQLEPLIAALLGTSTGVEVFHAKTYGTMLSAHLAGQFRYSAVNLGYTRGVSPGNGFYLSSQAESVYAAYSYVPFRNWSAGLQGTYMRLSPRTQTLTRFENYTASANIGRRIVGWLSYTAGAAIRRSEIRNTFRRDSYVIFMGLGLSPGEVPVSFW